MRFLQRNVYQSVADHVRARLEALGWVDEPVNFGAAPVVLREIERQGKPQRIEPTTVSLWVPGESNDRLHELGGPTYMVDVDFVADIYAAKPSIAVALGSDLKAMFRDRVIPLLDYGASGSTPAQAGTVELQDAWLDRPMASANAIEFHGSWRVVRAFTRVWFEDVDEE